MLQVLPAERKTDVSRGTSAIGAVPHLLSHPFRSRIRQLPLFRPESRRSSDRRDRPGYAGENACTEYGSEIQGPFRAALCQDILTQRKHPISCAARSGGIFIPAGNGSVLAESPWIAYFTAVLHLQQRMPAKLSVSSTRTFRPYKNNSADGPGILCSLRFPSFIRMPAASLQYRKRQRQPFRKTSGTAFSRPRRRGHTKLSRPLSTDVPHRWMVPLQHQGLPQAAVPDNFLSIYFSISLYFFLTARGFFDATPGRRGYWLPVGFTFSTVMI